MPRPHDTSVEARRNVSRDVLEWILDSDPALREWGVAAASLGDTAERLAANSRWEYDNLPYWGGEVDCCINGYTLANGAWLGADVSGIAQWFLDHRLEDGGWNCEWVNGSTRSSVHSTLNFREAPTHDGTAPDARMAEAIETVRRGRQPDGTWLQEQRYPGRVWFDVDVPPGQPSKWLTCIGTRVLAWWDGRFQGSHA